ncbi:MAG: T9SS type A sorting domain-containing protein [Saprospiraceae bacterium]|nr:T9SS type A sorting domain-containing protein [Saprospiraceae bacterium]
MKKSILIIIAAWLFAAQLLAQSQSYNLGAEYGGGLIVYLEPGGTWGLVAAKENVPSPGGGLTWYQAFDSCQQWVHAHKGNWFLPSEPEFNYMLPYRSQLNLTGYQYWTASDFGGAKSVKNIQGLPFTTAGFPGSTANGFGSIYARAMRRFYIPLTGAAGEPACLPATSGAAYVPGPATITYGAGINIGNTSRRMNVTIGELAVGQARDGVNSVAFGSLSGFLLAPFEPIVTASQGELLDRIQISWAPNPLGPLPTEGYKLYRDGVFIGAFDNKVRNFNDFNVIAGRPYKYEVVGINVYGDGARGAALGFQVPNGVVTGYIQTMNSSPVVDAVVTLMPMQGFSLLLDPSDLAFANDTAGFLKDAANWTLSTWIQTDSAHIGSKIFEFEGASWSLTPIASATSHEGVTLNVTGQSSLDIQFPDSTKHGWHHIAITHDGAQFRAYLDGALAGSIMVAAVNGDTKMLNLAGEGSQWKGRIDELRIYHQKLDELDFGEVIEGTASSLTPGLKYYWKMDEELGTKSFDIIGRNRLFFCGGAFDKSRPPVRTSGKTDENGYYRIESANYGTGTTFIATPSKLFYMHRALKFARAEQDYATLPDFGLTDSTELETATLELWANSAGPDGPQCLVSKKWGSNEFRLSLAPNGNINDLKCYLNGTEQTLSSFGMGFQHIALTFQRAGSDLTVNTYKNGSAVGTTTFPAPAGNWSDTTQTWLLGARTNGLARTDYFGGLLDELAVYDTILPAADIQAHASASRDPLQRHLRAYFALDEGAGNQLNNAGAALTGAGKSFGTEWTPFAANQTTEPHEFAPKTRQVTLNPSVTSVDQVDFTDRSTVPVSGFVRYKNTDCFAKGIEILINGERFSPPIFTDSTGQFIVDFEPGVTAVLTPQFEDHQFLPASWQVININSPIAGILFNDVTTRKIDGQIAGGHCKKSIISGPAEDCRIKVRTKDGCYEREMQVTAVDGAYLFENLPPLELTIAITKHNNLAIYTDFQNQGGRTIDLSKKDSTDVDFIYIAPPQVLVEGFDDYLTTCAPPLIVIPQWDVVELTIKAYEQYGVGQDPDEQCELDSALLSINNTFDHDYDFTTPLDTFYTGGQFKYKFIVDRPNPFEPFKRTMEVVADDQGRKSVPFLQEVIVTGLVVGEAKFTTQLPMMPSYVLRDPPGDGSYAYLEKETKVCNSLHFGEEVKLAYMTESEYTKGANIETTLPFVGTHVEAEIEYENSKEFTTTLRTTSTQNLDYCVTNKEVLSTDDGDLVVGGATLLDLVSNDTLAGNDIYVGIGFNVIFSDSKEVSFNNCEAKVMTVTTVSPDTFVTNYKYSEWNLENHVIRYLDTLIQNGFDADGINTTSKTKWENYIAMNKALKKAAQYQQNISFDAGVQYEASVTIDSSFQWEADETIELESMNELFFEVKVVKPVTTGFTIDATITVGGSATTGGGGESSESVTTGYVLKDDDPGDNWTIDIKADPMFHTPVFDVKAGQSSCPWEVGTAHRDRISMIPIDGTNRTGVASNEAAVFHFELGNNSPTFELRTYTLTAGPESNPDGAVIKVNGAILDHNIYYAVDYGTTQPVTITVERGPEAYSYPGLEVVTFVDCHDGRAAALGFIPDNETFLYSANYLAVEFVEPCSEVDISFPFDGWVVKPDTIGNPDLLPITVYGYNKNDPDFLGIRLQYRPSNGDGAWINITGGMPDYIPKAELGNIFTQKDWDTGGSPKLADGPYEIRAISVCDGGPKNNPGYSHVIKGRIERQAPSLVGTPEPADGVYNVGDEISFTFNKEINCAKLNEVDNVLLFDATTDMPIDIGITCYENKIVLVPNVQNQFLENKILRAELHGIRDLTGNEFEGTKPNKGIWEFFVDRNELAWLTDSIGMTKTEGETKTMTASIHNRGGAPMPFTITGAPAWARVVPDKGTLVPNEIRPIRFEVDSTLAFGLWSDTVVLHTETGLNPNFMGGDEALPIGVRVVCEPPNWDLDANSHPVTMNMVVALNIQGTLSIDEEDIVAAFINDELRGRARIQYFPSVNKYLAHLTIYGETSEQNQPVTLQIWDASDCLRYGSVVESFTFQFENVVGTPLNPQVLHTNNLVLREIPLNNGWNWISFNLAFPDPALDPALASLDHPANDMIKAQNGFSMYSSGWFGTIPALNNTGMFQYRADQPDTLNMMGNVVDPATTNIALNSGWNWVGYVPNYSLPVNEALGSITAVTGDLIKGQYGFSQYIGGFGWIGNLKFMYPPLGYQMKLTNPGTLTYPPNSHFKGGNLESRRESPAISSFWSPDPTKFENSMTLVGMLANNGQNTTQMSHEIGAFAGAELRGAGQAIYVEPEDSYLFFLTMYANSSGEQLHFKLHDAASGQVNTLAETMYFAPDLHQGSIEAPVPFSLLTSGLVETGARQSLDVQPNPFTDATMLRFSAAKDQEVQFIVTDVQGREIERFRMTARQGWNAWNWQPDLSAGLYYIRLQTAEGTAVRKLIKE